VSDLDDGPPAAPFRVQPALDDGNRFFWTSGEDGRLRFLRCQACGYYVQPPGPRCPTCWSRELAPEVVSGRAEVHTFTINHHPWDGGTEPYAIAIVTFPEQDDLRLTTNVVGCPPEDVHIGMAVRVSFEHHGDTWIPVFEPVREEAS
jgi:uncharacterized OB-fold protein